MIELVYERWLRQIYLARLRVIAKTTEMQNARLELLAQSGPGR